MSQKKTKNSKGRERIEVKNFDQALDALRHGEVIVFPTETFYGLGADALNGDAVERVVSIKGREAKNPIPIIVSDEEMLRTVVAELPPLAQRLMDRFWPGPLTLVLTAKKGLPAPLLNRDGGVGVRISSHSLASRLVRDLGRPLTATSANLSGKEPARTVAEAQAYFSGRLNIFIDGGRLPGKKGSTVMKIAQDRWQILREGEISLEALERVLTPAG